MANIEPLGFSVADFAASRASSNPYSDKGFQWRGEYLPVVVGFVGVISLPMIIKLSKKWRKKKKK